MILPFSTIVDIIAHRLEGVGIRKTARLCGVDRKTVAYWSRVVGEGCARLLDRRFRNLPILQLELDELHTFVATKQRRLRRGAPQEHGDCWGYFALCKTSRAVVCHLVGKRTLKSTLRFVAELRARTVGRPHICTDGYGGYLTAIARAYGDDVDYLQLVKDYESVTTESGRRLADAFVRAERRPMMGNMVFIGSSTSHVERFNATVRHLVSKFARRSFQHAKSYPHLVADVAMLTASYDFVRVHSSLKTTPAVVLGLADRAWRLDELIQAALVEPDPEPLLLSTWATAPQTARAPGGESSRPMSASPSNSAHGASSRLVGQETALQEVLLLLGRGSAMTAKQLAEEMRCSIAITYQRLRTLEARGCVVQKTPAHNGSRGRPARTYALTKDPASHQTTAADIGEAAVLASCEAEEQEEHQPERDAPEVVLASGSGR